MKRDYRAFVPGASSPGRSRCESVSDRLAAAAGGDRALRPVEADHLASCLRCRAEELRYRKLLHTMRSIREAPADADPRLEAQILLCLDRQDLPRTMHFRSRLAAAVGGLAAGAAATAGVIALAAKHRRTARLAG